MIKYVNIKRVAGALALAAFFISGTLQAQSVTFGHPGYAQGANGLFNGATTDGFAIRFTQQGTRTVTGVWISIQVNGTPPVYRFGIQGDDSAGDHDGNFIVSTDYAHAGGPGWVKVVLPETSLTDGTVYHLVFQYLSGFTDIYNKLQFAASKPNFTYIPPSMIDDPNLRLSYGHKSPPPAWIPFENVPEFLIEYADASHYGVAYNEPWPSPVSLNFQLYGTNHLAQRFVVPDSIAVDSLELRVLKMARRQLVSNT